jgi:T4 RnlA family RNA ligase
MKLDLTVLNKYIEDGWVVKNDHPTHSISIYNYAPKTQYEGKWDNITKSCRGLVLDSEGNVVARAFNKFFNLEEHKPEELPNEPFEVYEKMDGSLGIVFYYKGEWHVATRGSFTSDQAVKGKEMLNQMSVIRNYPTTGLNTNWTYLFEIIYDENRIVCEYDFEGLVLIGIYDNETGEEVSWNEAIKLFALYSDFRIVKRYNGITDYSILGGMISSDREGYVVRFKNGMRVKIKGEDYKRLHRIITNMSSRDIWEYLVNDKPFDDLLERVPDEFYNWVKSTKKELEFQFYIIEREYRLIYKNIMETYNPADRKSFAEIATKYKHPNLLFLMHDNKDCKRIIWNLIYPDYVKPFWNKDVDN